MSLLLGGNWSSAFPWSSLTDVTTKDCPATAHRNILSLFHCRRSLFRTKHKSANDAWNQWALSWQFACHSISSSCTVNAKSKEMHRDTVHNPSQCLLLCTEVDQCLWLQRFIIQNAEDVSVINCVFACDVRVLRNLKECSMLTQLLEFFISLYGKCCGWNQKCSLLVSSSKSKWKGY